MTRGRNTPHACELTSCISTSTAPAHQRLPAIQVGSLPTGPTIIFYATPGAAQALQLQGKDEGAEVIGSALLFPNNASGSLLTKVENCTSIGVSGLSVPPRMRVRT